MTTASIDTENQAAVWQQIYDKALENIRAEDNIKRDQVISTAKSALRYVGIALSISVIATMLILIVAFITLKTEAITLDQSQRFVELTFWVMLTLSGGVCTVLNVGRFERVAKTRAAAFATAILEKRDQMNEIDVVIEAREELKANQAYRHHGVPSHKHIPEA